MDEKRVDSVLSDWRAPFPEREKSWEQLENKLQLNQRKKRSPRPWIAAASVAVLAGFVAVMSVNDGMDTITAEAAEQLTHHLPDGSVVRLNAVSTLSYDEADFESERYLNLEGEAYFQVEKGQTFTVHTVMGDITVLGTEFNVYSRNGKLEVQCTEGKVSVKDSDQEVLLTAGEQAISHDGFLSENKTEEAGIAWLEGRFEFDASPLAEVLDEVSRQFDVEIAHEGLDGMRFTGYFESTDLETALGIICSPMGLEFGQTTDGRIEIERR